MTARRRNRRRGTALVEFAMIGAPLIFIWISVFQMAIIEWRYHTLQYAVKMTTSYMSTHGSDCSTGGNTCSIEIENAAQILENAAVGIPPKAISVTFTPIGSDHVTAAGGSYPLTCTLDQCLTNTTSYPPTGYGDRGCDIKITASYTFNSMLGMFVPGQNSVHFGTYTFTSDSQQAILF
ncbi:MAG TPA: TadE family protein [Bryobacteraceae bacterium]|nr:TadE family protein [Bryobacteraceae bacterium]